MNNDEIFKQLQHIRNVEIQLNRMKETFFDQLITNCHKEDKEANIEDIAISLCNTIGMTHGVKFFRTYVKMDLREAWEHLRSLKNNE